MGSNRLNRTASRRGGPLTSAVKLTSSLRWFSECQRFGHSQYTFELGAGLPQRQMQNSVARHHKFVRTMPKSMQKVRCNERCHDQQGSSSAVVSGRSRKPRGSSAQREASRQLIKMLCRILHFNFSSTSSRRTQPTAVRLWRSRTWGISLDLFHVPQWSRRPRISYCRLNIGIRNVALRPLSLRLGAQITVGWRCL